MQINQCMLYTVLHRMIKPWTWCRAWSFCRTIGDDEWMFLCLLEMCLPLLRSGTLSIWSCVLEDHVFATNIDSMLWMLDLHLCLPICSYCANMWPLWPIFPHIILFKNRTIVTSIRFRAVFLTLLGSPICRPTALNSYYNSHENAVKMNSSCLHTNNNVGMWITKMVCDRRRNHKRMIRGFAKKKNSKNPRLQWKWVGWSRSHSGFFF